ncbi:excinuclease ABC subunit UvrB [bacterium]|nr:excinuclease ABC subunit UvrB [bacterium]
MENFKLVTPFKPQGDQPEAIRKLKNGLAQHYPYQTLLGVTGSGKTYTCAHVVASYNKPTLVISHNKTLAAQLYSEFKEFFPDNAVEYFVSFYDYYQPEAYLPQTDTYIQKDCSINEEIDRLRLLATSSLVSRNDTLVVASVSCIYSLGSPEDYRELLLELKVGQNIDREEILKGLINIHYERNDIDFRRGKFRVCGDTVEIFPSYEEQGVKVELFGDEIEKISYINPVTRAATKTTEHIFIYPAKHFVTTYDRIKIALAAIEQELKERLKELESGGRLLEAQRLAERTKYDIEMLREMGYCQGIENYSRHLSGRAPGERPQTLIDYFPRDWLLIIDESHVTIPQFKGMYKGDRSRKECLIEHGFRLPSALDNRPLKFSEFEALMPATIFVSATPGPYEIRASCQIVEQIIRPTGLIDPEIVVKPTAGQIDDLISEIRQRTKRKERTLVTTLTKRMAEDLADYLTKEGLRVRYLHFEIDTLERIDILRDLRLGEFDCLIGINLLREGLDLPEVSLVAILDADKEGFLRSEMSLIQVAGRCARNLGGLVIMYAEKMTGSMKRAISETNRRRKIQLDYNRKHNITPETVKKEVAKPIIGPKFVYEPKIKYKTRDLAAVILDLEEEMKRAADNLEYEKAAAIRDEIFSLKKNILTNLAI